jgi:catechol 2,3-dioxygenase-like lactoylglutathione lyase family enzyme
MLKDKSPFMKICHLGWVVKDLNKSIKYYEELGIGPWYKYTLPSPGHDFTRRELLGKPADSVICEVALAKWGTIDVELFEVISGDSLQKRFLESKGEGIWHIGYLVSPEEFDKTVAEMTEKGFKIIGRATYENGARMIYFDTDKLGGVLFQLHDYPPEFATLASTMGMLLT